MANAHKRRARTHKHPRSLRFALLFGLQSSQQRYPQLSRHPRTEGECNSEQGCKGFEPPRLPCCDHRWHFDNLSHTNAVDTPRVDGIDAEVVTIAIHLFDLIDGVACHTLGDVDAIMEIHAVEAQAVTPLYTGVLHGDKSHLRRAGGKQKHERE